MIKDEQKNKEHWVPSSIEKFLNFAKFVIESIKELEFGGTLIAVMNFAFLVFFAIVVTVIFVQTKRAKP